MLALFRSAALAAPVAGAAVRAAQWACELPPVREETFGELLTELAAWTVVGCCLWALGLLLAATTEALTHGRVAATRAVPCPDRWRRVALAAVGVTAACAVAAPAQAQDARVPHPASYGALDQATDQATHRATDRATDRTSSGRLPVPARPDGVVRTERPTPERAHVVVREGDSLWRLVADRLPAARACAIEAAVRTTYRANRRVIGPDPDLLHPGQRLVLPLPQPHPTDAGEPPDHRP